MRKLSIKDAINEALVESFQNDKNVILMGEDIAGGKEERSILALKIVGADHLVLPRAC